MVLKDNSIFLSRLGEINKINISKVIMNLDINAILESQILMEANS